MDFKEDSNSGIKKFKYRTRAIIRKILGEKEETDMLHITGSYFHCRIKK